MSLLKVPTLTIFKESMYIRLKSPGPLPSSSRGNAREQINRQWRLLKLSDNWQSVPARDHKGHKRSVENRKLKYLQFLSSLPESVPDTEMGDLLLSLLDSPAWKRQIIRENYQRKKRK